MMDDDFDRARRADLVKAFSSPCFRPPRKRKPTLKAALAEADRAGKPVKGAAIYSDRVELRFGEPEALTTTNPWDIAADEIRRKGAVQ
jgi:hypothetical protein